MAKLVFTEGDFKGRVYELVLEKTAVGRASNNDLVIHDASVSHNHCQILVNGPEVIVCDLNSSNGIFVDGLRVHGQCQVKSGQSVRFGNVAARLELDLPPLTEEPTSMTAVHSLRDYQRAEEREQHKPKPPPAALTLDSGAPANSDERTLVLPRNAFPHTPTPPATADRPEDSQGNRQRSLALRIGLGVIVVGLLILIWLVWGRK